MSYEIVYGRSFISVGNGKYIPLVLSGASNCTQINYKTGKEILERRWNVFWGSKDIITTKDQMLDWAKYVIENHSPKYEAEWFKQGGSWVTGEKIFKWIENGCKSAYTLEDYIKYANTYIKCEIVLYTSTGDFSSRWERKNAAFPKTTEELIAWIEEYEKFDKGSADSKYANIEFAKDERLKISAPAKDETLAKPYIVKCGKRYLVDYSGKQSITVTENKREAKVFVGKDEYEKVKACCAFFGYCFKVVSAESILEPAPYYIKVAQGWYAECHYLVKKKTSRRLFFTKDLNEAMRFKTQKAAEKYAMSLSTTTMCEKYAVCKVEEDEKGGE